MREIYRVRAEILKANAYSLNGARKGFFSYASAPDQRWEGGKFYIDELQGAALGLAVASVWILQRVKVQAEELISSLDKRAPETY